MLINFPITLSGNSQYFHPLFFSFCPIILNLFSKIFSINQFLYSSSVFKIGLPKRTSQNFKKFLQQLLLTSTPPNIPLLFLFPSNYSSIMPHMGSPYYSKNYAGIIGSPLLVVPVENLLLLVLVYAGSTRLKPNPNFFNSPSQSDGVGKEGSVPESLLKQAGKTGSLNLSNR